MTQWECKECEHRFLWIRKGERTKPEACPKCGSKKLDVREV